MKQEDISRIKSWLDTGAINIFGRPFSGKDTQSKALAKIFDAPVIGSGDILRASNDPTILGKIDYGYMAPTDAFLDLILPYFKQSQFDGRPLILSTVGRLHGEEDSIMQGLADSGHPLKAVICLSLTEEEVRSRLKAAQDMGDRGRRADDQHGIIDVRLEQYREKTVPVIEFYRQKGLLIEVDGSLPPNEVTDTILQELLSRALA